MPCQQRQGVSMSIALQAPATIDLHVSPLVAIFGPGETTRVLAEHRIVAAANVSPHLTPPARSITVLRI